MLNFPKGEVVVFDTQEKSRKYKEILPTLKQSEQINFIIGPEGGFDEKEIEHMQKAGGKSVSLGDLILRTETVAVAVSAPIRFDI